MPSIRHSIGIGADAASVHRSLTTIEGIRDWWDGDAGGDAQEGGRFEFSGGRMDVAEGGPTRVRWHYSGPAEDWRGTEVRFELAERDGRTSVLFTHADWHVATAFLPYCSMKWATFLLSLKDLHERGRGRPIPHEIPID